MYKLHWRVNIGHWFSCCEEFDMLARVQRGCCTTHWSMVASDFVELGCGTIVLLFLLFTVIVTHFYTTGNFLHCFWFHVFQWSPLAPICNNIFGCSSVSSSHTGWILWIRLRRIFCPIVLSTCLSCNMSPSLFCAFCLARWWLSLTIRNIFSTTWASFIWHFFVY